MNPFYWYAAAFTVLFIFTLFIQYYRNDQITIADLATAFLVGGASPIIILFAACVAPLILMGIVLNNDSTVYKKKR